MTYCLADNQIVDETMLENINCILNSGEVPNLFQQEEVDRIVADMFSILKVSQVRCVALEPPENDAWTLDGCLEPQELGIPETRDRAMQLFVHRVRDNLHIVLCMSPVGDALRLRCRQYPSLINCMTIDWYLPWPEVALSAVASRFISNLDLPNESTRSGLVAMCSYIHKSIETASDKYFAALRRRLYTTPKSYLDLIRLYISLLGEQQSALEKRMQKMVSGVRKLHETNEMVATLQRELQELQPILQDKTVQTETLLAQVAQDTEAADRVRATTPI
jgi:dynein heavy chain